jgi:hypothetical protein
MGWSITIMTREEIDLLIAENEARRAELQASIDARRERQLAGLEPIYDDVPAAVVQRHRPDNLIFKTNENALQAQPQSRSGTMDEQWNDWLDDRIATWLDDFADDLGTEVGREHAKLYKEIGKLRADIEVLRAIINGTVTPIKGSSRDAA